MYCVKCGAKIEKGASFCVRCGAPLQNQNDTQRVQGLNFAQSAGEAKVTSAKKKIRALVAVVCVLSAIVIGGGVYLIINMLSPQASAMDVAFDADNSSYEETTLDYEETISNYDVTEISYLDWGSQEWAAATDEQKYNAVIEIMYEILDHQGISVSGILAQEIEYQGLDWVESVNIYYGLEIGSGTVFDILNTSTILNNLFLGAGYK